MDGWEKFGARITKEMAEADPPWIPHSIYMATAELDPKGKGIGPSTLSRWQEGEPIKHIRRAYLLCDLFHWTHASVDLIRQGSEPEYVEDSGLPANVREEVEALASAIEDAAASIRRTIAQVDRSPS